MKLLIGKSLAYGLFYLGDLVSKPMHWANWLAHCLYPVYNRLMIWSGNAQDWCGCEGPWYPCNEDENPQ